MFLTLLLILPAAHGQGQYTTVQKDSNDFVVSLPVYVADDDWSFTGTENMLFVPENRNSETSRKIPLHFFHFPAKGTATLPPVVFLGAGPGEPYSVKVFYDGKRAEAWRYELDFVNQNRDVILINQRGNPDTPGMQIPQFKYKWNNGGSLETPFDPNLRNDKRKAAYTESIAVYTKNGIDLRGYDILHFVDDIEAVRTHLKTEKIALIGNSFASQWALGYIQRYPLHVDRALFSGVEPLDHNYDDPQGIWEVFEKIEAYAQQDPNVSRSLPKIGLVEAFKTVIERLERHPETVVLKGFDDGRDVTIVVGADDLRFNKLNPRVQSYSAEIESWPKYITEMYHGDFRYLAMLSYGRIYNSSSLMIDPLVNNSLGISKKREAILKKRPAVKWLGDINQHYTATRDICPSPKVEDAFRLHKVHDIPLLLIQGDMDLSTPYDNATFLMETLNKGHLLTIKRGFHNAKRALIFANRELTDSVYEFMNIDFEHTEFEAFKKQLPKEFTLPEFQFWPIQGESLYEKHTK